MLAITAVTNFFNNITPLELIPYLLAHKAHNKTNRLYYFPALRHNCIPTAKMDMKSENNG